MWAILSPLTCICCRILFGVASAKPRCFYYFYLQFIIQHISIFKHFLPTLIGFMFHSHKEMKRTSSIYLYNIFWYIKFSAKYIYVCVMINNRYCWHKLSSPSMKQESRIRRKTRQNEEEWVNNAEKLKSEGKLKGLMRVNFLFAPHFVIIIQIQCHISSFWNF